MGKKVFIIYEKDKGKRCLLIMDKAASHISKDSIAFLDANKVNYVLIPLGMTPVCQPLDISVNKVFQDNVKFLFEKERLYYDNINPKIKSK